MLRFDLAPDADPGLLDSSIPATVASAGVFDHVAIAVADLAASERFYRTVLFVPATTAFVLDPDGHNVEVVNHNR